MVVCVSGSSLVGCGAGNHQAPPKQRSSAPIYEHVKVSGELSGHGPGTTKTTIEKVYP